MESQYNPHSLEPTVQQQWVDNNCFATSSPATQSNPNFYCLSMFPYPSGKLHIGHVRNYTIGDVISRFHRALGKNVLQPMGWDAFGLPAENAAIKNQVPPAHWTKSNIRYMREQLKRLGFGYDWSREVATCHPSYYRWEQWLFTRLFKKGLVYRKNAIVNWDPIDRTVLANEQVIEGRGWRSGALVERREIPQWFLRITDYAEELLSGLDELTEWPEQVRIMQKNWIGKSKGVNIEFKLPSSPLYKESSLRVFTTRPDTLMGVTYLAVAAQHPLAKAAAQENLALKEFIKKCANIKSAEAEIATMEKAGAATGFTATHPITGDALPIWVANFVLIEYGSGAVMSVPAHDQRDWEFAQQYNLPIKTVIKPTDCNDAAIIDQLTQESAFTEKGVTINSGVFNDLEFDEAFEAISTELSKKNSGSVETNYRLRDWGVSRQRYWGTPIPIVYCEDCGDVAVPEKDLPVVLPTEVTFDASGGSPLKQDENFINTTCPNCGKAAKRETDTFDTFMESSWYYARFTSARDDTAMVSEEGKNWLPVDQYIGGIEHAVLHLLYARFFHKLMRDEGLTSGNEPFKRLLCQGMVVAETYFEEAQNGKITYYTPDEVTLEKDDKGKVISAKLISNSQPVTVGPIEKMSKSKNNGVDPANLIDSFGADTARLFTMFAAPPEQSLEWSDAGVEGAFRYLKRLWRLVSEHVNATTNYKKSATPFTHNSYDTTGLSTEQENIRRKIHQTITKVSDDIERRHTFNTAIAAIMELTNVLQKAHKTNTQTPSSLNSDILQEGLTAITALLAPITPHICTELWSELGNTSRLDQYWPKVDESALTAVNMSLVIQVNGKLRGKIEVNPGALQDEWVEAAKAEPSVNKFFSEGSIRKTIVVPGKLINFVVK